jgi:hypothetical protein
MKFRIISALCLASVIAVKTNAQALRNAAVAPCIGQGAYSLQQTDAFSFISNQAALAQLKNAAAGIYGERRFFLPELNSYLATLVLPLQSGGAGLKLRYSGFSQFNETGLSLAYARRLGDKAGIGVQFNYHGVSIEDYGNAAALSVEIGAIFHLSEKLNTGFHVNNPAGGKFRNASQEKLPAIYTFGMGYEPSDKFFLNMEIIKEEDQPVDIIAGFQYRFVSRVLIRAGIASATSSVWAGPGLSIGGFRMDIITSYHPQLGISPGMLLIFNFKTKTLVRDEK